MFRKITVLALIGFFFLSFGAAVSTLLEVNVSEAKRVAKQLVNEDLVSFDFEKKDVSVDFKKFIQSTKGRQYYQDIKSQNGELKSLKFKALIGSTEDTMNYRFLGKFKNQSREMEVRVQTYQDKEIIAVWAAPWKDKMSEIGLISENR